MTCSAPIERFPYQFPATPPGRENEFPAGSSGNRAISLITKSFSTFDDGVGDFSHDLPARQGKASPRGPCASPAGAGGTRHARTRLPGGQDLIGAQEAQIMNPAPFMRPLGS